MNITPSLEKQSSFVANNLIDKEVKASIANQGWQPTREQKHDYLEFEIYCNNCNEKIARGKCTKDGNPEFHYWDITYFYRMKRVKGKGLKWLGAYEFNIDPKSHQLRCGCCCGNNWKTDSGLITGPKYKGFTFKIVN